MYRKKNIETGIHSCFFVYIGNYVSYIRTYHHMIHSFSTLHKLRYTKTKKQKEKKEKQNYNTTFFQRAHLKRVHKFNNNKNKIYNIIEVYVNIYE